MGILELMKLRHSVRSYNSKKIEGNVALELQKVIAESNKQGGLNIQLCLNEPNAFDSIMAHYGKFSNVNNYIALVGKKSAKLDEKLGYYGEKIVLKATELGLGTCWVAATYSKGKCACKVAKDEKLLCVISLGYFEKDGITHKTKSIDKLSQVNGKMPDWFEKGMKAAQLAPTAMNQQKFTIVYNGENKVTAKAGMGFYTKIDLGIAKYHFELGADNPKLKWNK